MSYNMQKMQTPLGVVYLVEGEQKLCGIVFPQMWDYFVTRFPNCVERDTALLKETKKQLNEYFEGTRKEFDLPLNLMGTEFQKKVWNALRTIPYGETRTYLEQARRIQSPNAARAVGRADGLNPLCILLPCHRVVGSSGALTGYAGGLDAKKYLLDFERGELSGTKKTRSSV